jgi:nucleotide-binding universal stress UspA family protein
LFWENIKMLSHLGLQFHDEEGSLPTRAVVNSIQENMPHAAARPQMLACVDGSPIDFAVAEHAAAIAESLGLEVTLARVIEDGGGPARPVDPIEWRLQCQEQRARLRDLAGGLGNIHHANDVLLAGNPARELIDWCHANGTTLLALATRHDRRHHGIGSTALQILESGSTSLLFVPPYAPAVKRYRRILVPIDGSARAESVLPVARRIARAHGAELLLAHVIPVAGRNAGFRFAQMTDLHSEIERQNAQLARQHLEQLRARALAGEVNVRSATLGPADPRQAVCSFAREQDIDLVVMSSHGATALNDVPCGSVAEYLATHCEMPVLMVRPSLVTGFGNEGPDVPGQSVFNFG